MRRGFYHGLMNIENRSLNEKIRIMAAASGLSLAELARRAGDSPQGLNQRLKTGKLSADLEYIERLAAACGFSFVWDFVEKPGGGSVNAPKDHIEG